MHRHLFSFIAAVVLLTMPQVSLAQTTVWIGGTGDWTDAAKWSNGIPIANSDVVIDELPSIVSDVTGAVGTINSLTIGADDSIRLGGHMTVNASVNNKGAITIDQGGPGWVLAAGQSINNFGSIDISIISFGDNRIFIRKNTSLAGEGIVQIFGTAAGFVFGNTDATFTNVDNTIRGVGIIGRVSPGGGNMTFNNQGTIDADLTGFQFRIKNLGDSGAVNNSGMMKASNGGFLEIDSVMIDNDGGTILAVDGSTVTINRIIGDRTVANGTIETVGSGRVRVSGRIRDATLNGNMITYNAYLAGDILNLGTVSTRFESGNLLQVSETTVLTGGGEIMMDDFASFAVERRVADSFVNVDNLITGRGGLDANSFDIQTAARISPGFADSSSFALQMGWFSIVGSGNFNCPIELQARIKPNDPAVIRNSVDEFDIVVCYGDAIVDGPMTLEFVDGLQPVVGDHFDLLVAETIEIGPDFSFSGPTGYQFNVDLVARPYVAGPVDSIRVVVTEDPRINLVPDAFAITRGNLTAGDAGSLAVSDDSDLSLRRSSTDVQSVTELEVSTTSMLLVPAAIDLVVEASVFARTQIELQVEAFSYATTSFEVIDTMEANRFLDKIQRFTFPSNVADFVDPATGEIKARIRYTSPVNRQRFSANIDHIYWSVAK